MCVRIIALRPSPGFIAIKQEFLLTPDVGFTVQPSSAVAVVESINISVDRKRELRVNESDNVESA